MVKENMGLDEIKSLKDLSDQWNWFIPQNFDVKSLILVGAGISMNPPSNLPSAIDLMRTLFHQFIHNKKLENKIFNDIRYELIVEKIKDRIDPELSFLNYFNEVLQPNKFHYILAELIKRNYIVITTNFDYLIEEALKETTEERELQERLALHLTDKDFQWGGEYALLKDQGYWVLYKIHGSKKNFISQEDTSSSILTTIKSFFQNKQLGDSFLVLPSNRGEKWKELTEWSTIIIAGYSGNDDFDLSVEFQNLPDFNSLIWVDHCLNDEFEFNEIKPDQEYDFGMSKLDRLLLSISKKKHGDVYKLKVNTLQFFTEIFQNKLDLSIPDLDSNSGNIEFSEWLKKSDLYKAITSTQRSLFSIDILKSLNLITESIEYCLKSLHQPSMDNLHELQVREMYGDNLIFKGKYMEAKENYEIAYNIAKNIQNREKEAFFKTKLAYIYHFLGDLNKSIEMYFESQSICEDLEFKFGLIFNDSELFYLFYKLNNAELYKKKRSSHLLPHLNSIEYALMLGNPFLIWLSEINNLRILQLRGPSYLESQMKWLEVFGGKSQEDIGIQRYEKLLQIFELTGEIYYRSYTQFEYAKYLIQHKNFSSKIYDKKIHSLLFDASRGFKTIGNTPILEKINIIKKELNY